MRKDPEALRQRVVLAEAVPAVNPVLGRPPLTTSILMFFSSCTQANQSVLGSIALPSGSLISNWKPASDNP
jgi:hypothetical protein